MTPRVLIATDKFKGSATAREVALALAEGLRAGDPTLSVDPCPIADGGEGTVDAAMAAGFEPRAVDACDAWGRRQRGIIAWRRGTAIVELAAVAGAPSLGLDGPDPLHTTSRGAGLLVKRALDLGARRIVVGLGGSVSTDGGAGMVQALGASLRDGIGRELPPGGAALSRLASLDLAGLDPRLRKVDLEVATDVDSPLLGSAGAAATFGPQKGATDDQVTLLEGALHRWADVVGQATRTTMADNAGAGAAGGTAFAAMAVLGARQRPGAEIVLDLVGFDDRVHQAGLVVTGEGSLDAQTRYGKAPAVVSRRARRREVPVVAVAGRCSLPRGELAALGVVSVYELRHLEPDPERSHHLVAPLLQRIGAAIAREQGGARRWS